MSFAPAAATGNVPATANVLNRTPLTGVGWKGFLILSLLDYLIQS